MKKRTPQQIVRRIDAPYAWVDEDGLVGVRVSGGQVAIPAEVTPEERGRFVGRKGVIDGVGLAAQQVIRQPTILATFAAHEWAPGLAASSILGYGASMQICWTDDGRRLAAVWDHHRGFVGGDVDHEIAGGAWSGTTRIPPWVLYALAQCGLGSRRACERGEFLQNTLLALGEDGGA